MWVFGSHSDSRTDDISISQRDLLASKLLEIGKSALRTVREAETTSEKPQFQNAVTWLQKAFSIVEGGPETEQVDSQRLKVSIHLRAM